MLDVLHRRIRPNAPASAAAGFQLLAGSVVTLLISLDVFAQVAVEVVRLDGSSVSGRLVSMTPDVIRLEHEGTLRSISRDDALSLRVADLPSVRTPGLSASGWTLLATGDLLRLQTLVIDDESMLTKWSQFPAMPPLAIPIEVCRGMAIRLPGDRIQQGHVFSRLVDREEESDEIVLRNGDRIAGTFVGLSNGRILIETSAGEVAVDQGGSVSLVFNPDLVNVPDLPDIFTTLVLSDGSTLWASRVESNGDALLVDAVAGFKVVIPVTVLREMQFYSPRCVSLSSIHPTRQETTPFLSTRRGMRSGRNVIGSPLSVLGRRFAAGVGVSSGTSITWKLDNSAEQFVASVGVDDAAAGQGSVVFEVLLDDVSVWKSDRLTSRDAAVTVPPVNLGSAAELTLRTHFADRGHVFDFANWCDPVLIIR